MKFVVPLILIAFFALCLLGSALRAQSMRATGAIQGSVTDSTGSIIIGVRVSASNADSGAVRAAVTDESGQFRFSGLAVGNYTLRLDKEGFAPVMGQAVPVSAAQHIARQNNMPPAPRT